MARVLCHMPYTDSCWDLLFYLNILYAWISCSLPLSTTITPTLNLLNGAYVAKIPHSVDLFSAGKCPLLLYFDLPSLEVLKSLPELSYCFYLTILPLLISINLNSNMFTCQSSGPDPSFTLNFWLSTLLRMKVLSNFRKRWIAT